MNRILLSAVALVASCAVTADAFVLCQQRSGALVARDACRRKEEPLAPSALAPLGPRGADGVAGPAGPRGTHPLRLLDAAGVEIGVLLQFHPNQSLVEIEQPPLGRRVAFLVQPAGFSHNTAGAIATVYYGTTDCSGVPLLIPQTDVQVIGQVYGDSAYFSGEAPVTRGYGSGEYDTNGHPCEGTDRATGRGTCCRMTTGSRSLQAGIRVTLSTLGFVPPFHAEVR